MLRFLLRPPHPHYLGFDAGRDFEREIVVKVNAPEVLRAELTRPSWKREHVALGTNTDPYQWVEKTYELMPGIWEAMRDSRTPCSVLTKSPLLLRDIELFSADRRASPPTCRSPRSTRRPGAPASRTRPHPRKRIEAVAELNRAGIPTGVLIAPLMPGINDSPAQVEEILELCAEAGAVTIGGICLHLRGEVRDVFMDWLRPYRPDLVPRYERSTPAAPTRRRPSASGSRGWSGTGRRVTRAATRSRRHRKGTGRRRTRDGDPAGGAGVAVLSAGVRAAYCCRSAGRTTPAARGRAATSGTRPQALRQAELFEFAHVALERQLFAADRRGQVLGEHLGPRAISCSVCSRPGSVPAGGVEALEAGAQPLQLGVVEVGVLAQ